VHERTHIRPANRAFIGGSLDVLCAVPTNAQMSAWKNDRVLHVLVADYAFLPLLFFGANARVDSVDLVQLKDSPLVHA